MIKGKIKLNGTEIEVTSDDSNSMKEVLGYLIGNQKRQYNRKEESGDEADAEPKSEEQSVSTTVVNKRPNAHRPRTPYVKWDEKDVLVLAHAAIRFGSKITGIGKYAFEALAASGSTGRKLENVSIIAMRIHRYVYTGKNYGLSKPILDILKTHNLRVVQGSGGSVTTSTSGVPNTHTSGFARVAGLPMLEEA